MTESRLDRALAVFEQSVMFAGLADEVHAVIVDGSAVIVVDDDAALLRLCRLLEVGLQVEAG